MGSIIRILDFNERLDQKCYFCGEKRSVKYMVTDAIDDNNRHIVDEVPCCNRCVLQHVWASDNIGDN